ncbi:MAG: ThiF family adenylyltransferase [Planctomycetaceae bacterium]|nr:ThiF family adenylyltransferase [Planctomycetaceae bacterium]
MTTPLAEFDRYRKQVAFAAWGSSSQQRFSQASVLVVGCGALGTAQANLLTRAGIGRLVLADRDFVDLSNLQRQTLFDEQDVADLLPKAIAAARRLQRINSQVSVEPIVADVTCDNVVELVRSVDLVLDGTDNFETRFLLNEACWQERKPWVYGGCLGADGQSMTIVPGQTACFACLMPEGTPAAGTMPTCDTGGVLGTIIQMVAAVQVSEAMKILGGCVEQISRTLTVIDSWNLRFRTLSLEKLASRGCGVCREGRRDWLTGARTTQTHVLCGRNSVQLRVPLARPWDLADLERQMEPHGSVVRNAYLLKLVSTEFTLTVFPDGRVIATGTEDPAIARTWVRQTIGL